jgi:hypothetical protein
VIRVEGSYRNSRGNSSVVGYSIASNLPLFLSDGVSAIIVVGAGFDVAVPTTIDAWGMFTFGGSFSINRVEDGVNLVMRHSPGGCLGNDVDTLFVGGVLGIADERRVIRT